MSVASQLNDWVAVLANWLSLASFVVSVYAAVTISRVRREIVGRATLQTIISALEESDRTLIEMLGDFPANRRAVSAHLARCEANLRVLITSRNAAAPRAVRLVELIATSTGESVDHAWRVQAMLSGLLEELKRNAYMRQIGG